jgi:hypothetical protein
MAVSGRQKFQRTLSYHDVISASAIAMLVSANMRALSPMSSRCASARLMNSLCQYNTALSE